MIRGMGFCLWIAGLLVVARAGAAYLPNDHPSVQAPPQEPAPLASIADQISVPDGFQVTLFAGEPDVRQPIAFTLDDRGRLWVVECYSYPNWMPGSVRGQDRIVIYDDADGDGKCDSRKVFYDRGDNFTGIELGFGGVWVCSTPNLIFIPDRDANDAPDSDPQVVLDGWDPNSRHNAFNALKWGPDGWLYGCNGILSNSKIGRPGTPDAQRVAMNCGVWRYHPTQHIFEAVAHGTTNPWGLDFDDYGEMFITNCVIPHLFHVVPGARFERMFGQDMNPHTYKLMRSCADHIHWGGGDWTSSRGGQGIHSVAGGGHAHAGAMIYLGDNWPDSYRNSVYTCNIHGRRVNHDRLKRSGSGYVATHASDFLLSPDEWFRGLELRYGPDGAVFLTDWSDIGECHDYDAAHGAHRNSGRIFKISYGPTKRVRVDLAQRGLNELVELQKHKNDWYVRHSRRLLQERAAAGIDMGSVHTQLWRLFDDTTEVPQKLRAFWALRTTNGLDDTRLYGLLGHHNEYVRAWAVRWLCESRAPLDTTPGTDAITKLAVLASSDPSALVRLHVAAALQRIPLAQRWPIAHALVANRDNTLDANLTCMIWYGVEPLVALDRVAASDLAGRCTIPLVRRFLARRIVLDPGSMPTSPHDAPPGLIALVRTLQETRDSQIQLDVLGGIHDALQGQRRLTAPPGWNEMRSQWAEDSEQSEVFTLISLVFDDSRAADTLRAISGDPQRDIASRQRALQALTAHRITGLVPLLHALLNEPPMRGPTIRALAAYNDPATPRVLLDRYRDFTSAERADAVSTLSARPETALALLEAMEKGIIARHELSPYVARQLQAFGNKQVDDKLSKVWGTIREKSAEKSELIARTKAMLTPESLRRANLAKGRTLFQQTCAPCHRLYGEGTDIGPDLTGSNRDNLDFVLENVLDPNAIVGRDYKLTIVAMSDGRVLSGIVRERFDKALVLQTANERLTLSLADIEAIKESSVSMMPEGIFDKLSVDELRDLVAFLGRKAQDPNQ